MSKRMGLILRGSDEAMIAPFIDGGSPAFEVLRHWAHQNDYASGDITSDAAVLRVLLRVGAEAVHEQILDADYAQLACSTARQPKSAARDRSSCQADELR